VRFNVPSPLRLPLLARRAPYSCLPRCRAAAKHAGGHRGGLRRTTFITHFIY